MREALVFNGSNSLDFQDIRKNVIRIPEVFHAIREAQQILDALKQSPLDLINFLGSEDHVFLSQIRMKKFASAVVQTGLFKRYLRYNPMPDFFIGTINGDSPLRVALNQINFIEMVGESEAVPKPAGTADPAPAPIAPVSQSVLPSSVSAPLLSGVRLDEYAVFQRVVDDKFNRIHFETFDVQKMAEGLVANHGVDKFIFIGPGAWKSSIGSAAHLESITLDPHLTWFWDTAKGDRPVFGRRLAIAN